MNVLQMIVAIGIFSSLSSMMEQRPGWIGMGLVIEYPDGPEHSSKVVVRYVAADSPATSSGIRKGDVIVQVNGDVIEFNHAFDAFQYFSKFGAGDKIALALERSGRALKVELIPKEMSEEQFTAWRAAYERLKSQRSEQKYEKEMSGVRNPSLQLPDVQKLTLL